MRLFHPPKAEKINLCSGSTRIPGYVSVDLSHKADVVIDLDKKLLPFASDSARVIVCISAINYFTRSRAKEIIADCYRVLETGGIARFATQDLQKIAQKYVNRDEEFFMEKLPNGHDRYEGETMGDKFNSWFYGYQSHGKTCKYFYDYETLAKIFTQVGFAGVEEKEFRSSRIPQIERIDNRPEQMFFLEAVK